ncbi:FecR family protein [Paraflavitalea speifideaquila]|uniref:FecR family protein n=1 Tax=Paraflavitalea speifideaquila TaxID=3076558 RepID=UPI0028F16391|nr:FecR domain-containing protein [Paraflavitalea speifideiaquila]
MKDFRLFDITDFVMDEDFARWVYERRLEDDAAWNTWLARNPGKHLVIAEARSILESIYIAPPVLPAQEIEEEAARLLQTIQRHPVPQTPVISRMKARSWYVAAAVLVVCLMGGVLYLYFTWGHATPFTWEKMTASRQLIENVNTSDKPVTIALPDGSSLSLSPGSRIGYGNQFDSSVTRDVYLSGEAFFEVTKNPDRPFRVFANEIVTKVLGTSFTVRSFENDTTIQVIVRTGKVTVYSQAITNTRRSATDHKPGEVILTPNQQLVYEKTGHKFQKVLLDDPLLIVPRVSEQKMEYEDAPVVKVFNELGKAYGIGIVYDNELLEKCTVTADLKSETFYHKLDLICTAIGAVYEVIDGQVVIQSNGCQ